MNLNILAGLLTDQENQPHQYVGYFEDLKVEMIKAVWDAGTHSLDPESFEMFEWGIVQLCKTRGIPIDFIQNPPTEAPTR